MPQSQSGRCLRRNQRSLSCHKEIKVSVTDRDNPLLKKADVWLCEIILFLYFLNHHRYIQAHVVTHTLTHSQSLPFVKVIHEQGHGELMSRSSPGVIQGSSFSLFTALHTHPHTHTHISHSYPPPCYPFSFAEFIPCSMAPGCLLSIHDLIHI